MWYSLLPNIDVARTDSTPFVFDLLTFFPFKSEDANSITASKLASVAALQGDVPPFNDCAFTTLSVLQNMQYPTACPNDTKLTWYTPQKNFKFDTQCLTTLSNGVLFKEKYKQRYQVM